MTTSTTTTELAKLIVFECAYQYWHWRFDVVPDRATYMTKFLRKK